jgi:hypothetical protein
MLIDQSGTLGAEHARDMRRAADAYRLGRHGHARHGFRDFIARGLLGPVHNYRTY